MLEEGEEEMVAKETYNIDNDQSFIQRGTRDIPPDIFSP